MVRVVLLLLVAAGLVLFAIQNLTPTVLVVLGAKTLPFPLAVWVLGSLAAGVLTTFIFTGFSSLSKAGAVRRAGQRFGESSSGTPRSPWGGVGTKRGSEASGTHPKNTAGFRAASFEQSDEQPRDRQGGRPGKQRSENRRSNDDWEASDIDRERWDDWGEPEPTQQRTTPFSRTNIRDTSDDDWAKWEDDDRSPPTDTPSSRRSGTRPESTTRFQESDRYRNMQDSPSGRSSEVYDAEYRVLVPPYSAQPTPSPSDYSPPVPPPSAPPKPAPVEPDPLDDDDDWGLDDLDLKK